MLVGVADLVAKTIDDGPVHEQNQFREGACYSALFPITSPLKGEPFLGCDC